MKTKKMIMLLFAALLSVTTIVAKDLKTVVFKVDQMECPKCEKKVKDNIRYEKGIKNFKTDVATRTVTITYDADKTTVDKLQHGFNKFHYVAVPVVESAKNCKKEIGSCSVDK